jgi:hypothetical protein
LTVESTDTDQSTSPVASASAASGRGPCPRSRRCRTACAASTPPATARTTPADHARRSRCEAGKRSLQSPAGDRETAALAGRQTTASTVRSGSIARRSTPQNETPVNNPSQPRRSLGDTPQVLPCLLAPVRAGSVAGRSAGGVRRPHPCPNAAPHNHTSHFRNTPWVAATNCRYG